MTLPWTEKILNPRLTEIEKAWPSPIFLHVEPSLMYNKKGVLVLDKSAKMLLSVV